jgi:hypothetical protein
VHDTRPGGRRSAGCAEEKCFEVRTARPNVETDVSDNPNISDFEDGIEAAATQRIRHPLRETVLA